MVSIDSLLRGPRVIFDPWLRKIVVSLAREEVGWTESLRDLRLLPWIGMSVAVVIVSCEGRFLGSLSAAPSIVVEPTCITVIEFLRLASILREVLRRLGLLAIGLLCND